MIETLKKSTDRQLNKNGSLIYARQRIKGINIQSPKNIVSVSIAASKNRAVEFRSGTNITAAKKVDAVSLEVKVFRTKREFKFYNISESRIFNNALPDLKKYSKPDGEVKRFITYEKSKNGIIEKEMQIDFSKRHQKLLEDKKIAEAKIKEKEKKEKEKKERRKTDIYETIKSIKRLADNLTDEKKDIIDLTLIYSNVLIKKALLKTAEELSRSEKEQRDKWKQKRQEKKAEKKKEKNNDKSFELQKIDNINKEKKKKEDDKKEKNKKSYSNFEQIQRIYNNVSKVAGVASDLKNPDEDISDFSVRYAEKAVNYSVKTTAKLTKNAAKKAKKEARKIAASVIEKEYGGFLLIGIIALVVIVTMLVVIMMICNSYSETRYEMTNMTATFISDIVVDMDNRLKNVIETNSKDRSHNLYNDVIKIMNTELMKDTTVNIETSPWVTGKYDASKRLAYLNNPILYGQEFRNADYSVDIPGDYWDGNWKADGTEYDTQRHPITEWVIDNKYTVASDVTAYLDYIGIGYPELEEKDFYNASFYEGDSAEDTEKLWGSRVKDVKELWQISNKASYYVEKVKTSEPVKISVPQYTVQKVTQDPNCWFSYDVDNDGKEEAIVRRYKSVSIKNGCNYYSLEQRGNLKGNQEWEIRTDTDDLKLIGIVENYTQDKDLYVIGYITDNYYDKANLREYHEEDTADSKAVIVGFVKSGDEKIQIKDDDVLYEYAYKTGTEEIETAYYHYKYVGHIQLHPVNTRAVLDNAVMYADVGYWDKFPHRYDINDDKEKVVVDNYIYDNRVYFITDYLLNHENLIELYIEENKKKFPEGNDEQNKSIAIEELVTEYQMPSKWIPYSAEQLIKDMKLDKYPSTVLKVIQNYRSTFVSTTEGVLDDIITDMNYYRSKTVTELTEVQKYQYSILRDQKIISFVNNDAFIGNLFKKDTDKGEDKNKDKNKDKVPASDEKNYIMVPKVRFGEPKKFLDDINASGSEQLTLYASDNDKYHQLTSGIEFELPKDVKEIKIYAPCDGYLHFQGLDAPDGVWIRANKGKELLEVGIFGFEPFIKNGDELIDEITKQQMSKKTKPKYYGEDNKYFHELGLDKTEEEIGNMSKEEQDKYKEKLKKAKKDRKAAIANYEKTDLTKGLEIKKGDYLGTASSSILLTVENRTEHVSIDEEDPLYHDFKGWQVAPLRLIDQEQMDFRGCITENTEDNYSGNVLEVIEYLDSQKNYFWRSENLYEGDERYNDLLSYNTSAYIYKALAKFGYLETPENDESYGKINELKQAVKKFPKKSSAANGYIVFLKDGLCGIVVEADTKLMLCCEEDGLCRYHYYSKNDEPEYYEVIPEDKPEKKAETEKEK